MYIPDWWVWLIVNPVPTDFTIVCVMTHSAVLVIQDGETALDSARDVGEDEVVEYLESVGK